MLVLYDKNVTALLFVLSFLFIQGCRPQDFIGNTPFEKSLSISHYMDFQDSVLMNSRQGCAVYSDYLFVFHHTNDVIEIYDLNSKELWNTIQLSGSDLCNEEYHCNNANFGTQRFSDSDPFPLLYVSMEHICQHSILVLRVIENDNRLSIELVQRIELPKPEEISLFYTNCYIDENDGVFWVSGYTSDSYVASQGNYLRYVEFALPPVSSGHSIILQRTDVLQSCIFESISATQGGLIINGKLHQVFGGLYSPRYYVVFDFERTAVIKNDLSRVRCEPEGLFVWKDRYYYTSQHSVYCMQSTDKVYR